MTMKLRAEIWRDDNNFFVAAFPANNSFVQFQQGFPVTVNFAPGTNTTYGAITLGVTWKPELPVNVGAARHGDVVEDSRPPVAACTQFPGVRVEARTEVNEPRFGVVVPIVPFSVPPAHTW